MTINALNFRGKVLRTISLGQRPTGVLQVYRLPGKLPHGFRRLLVSATDLAGNTQSKLVGQHLPMLWGAETPSRAWPEPCVGSACSRLDDIGSASGTGPQFPANSRGRG